MLVLRSYSCSILSYKRVPRLAFVNHKGLFAVE